MKRSGAIDLLAHSKLFLAQRHGVTHLARSGFTARDSTGSEVEVLVAVDGPATSACCFGVQFYLEDLFGRTPVSEFLNDLRA